MTGRIVVLMGVSGSGKTTIGMLLAERLGWEFLDADDFHPAANVEKMRAGVPLDDADRAPWLAVLRERIDQRLACGPSAVLACSALKARYRERLGLPRPGVRLVHLAADAATIRRRLEGRRGHFMKADLLESQLDTLEAPVDALTIEPGDDPRTVAERLAERLVAEPG